MKINLTGMLNHRGGFWASFFISLNAVADPVGLVVTFNGRVLINSTEAGLDSKIHSGDRVKTGANSSIKIWMADQTVLDIGPRTTFHIKQYQIADNKRNAELQLQYGSVRAFISKKAKEGNHFHIKTKYGALAAQGTHFIIDASDIGYRTALLEGVASWLVGQKTHLIRPKHEVMISTECPGFQVSSTICDRELSNSELHERLLGAYVQDDTYRKSISEPERFGSRLDPSIRSFTDNILSTQKTLPSLKAVATDPIANELQNPSLNAKPSSSDAAGGGGGGSGSSGINGGTLTFEIHFRES